MKVSERFSRANFALRLGKLHARGQRAFTVIEVMITLAVTGLLFASAALLINGRQSQTQFNQSIRNIQTQIQQIINEVAIGYYPNLNNFNCTAGASGPAITAGSGAEQGANTGCIFVGKALQFKVAGMDPEEFAAYTIAGLQKGGAGGQESTSLSDARPLVVDLATDTRRLEGGLTTHRMWFTDGLTTQDIGAVAFTTTLAAYDAAGNITSGSQQVNVAPIATTAINQSQSAVTSAINSRLRLVTQVLNPSGGVFLCFASAGTDQSGLITIGSKGRQLSVNLEIKRGKVC